MGLFRRKTAVPVWELPFVLRHITGAVPELEAREIQPDVIRARLGDAFRDEGVLPPAPDRLMRLCTSFNPETWRRFALAVSLLEHEQLRKVIPLAVAKSDALRWVQEGLVTPSVELTLLTLQVLRQSDMRREEFGRHYALRLGVEIEGETVPESVAHLRSLDYAQLMADAAEAHKQAEEPMDYLRKLQEGEQRRRRPRGKF